MSIFLYSEEVKRTLQNELVGRLSIKNVFDASTPPQRKRCSIPSSAVESCLYERKQPVLVDANKLQKRDENLGGLKTQLFCHLCRKKYSWPCPLHGLRYTTSDGNASHRSRAVRSLPPEVIFCRSSVPGAEFGVCTRKHIPAGMWIGPFEGKRIRADDVKPGMDTSYMWEIFDGDKLTHFIDGSDEESSSWMRFIQCARSKDEQNLFTFQYKGNVYYRSFKDIAVGEELLVWYDEKYLQHFGIPIGLHNMFLVRDFGELLETHQKNASSPGKSQVEPEQRTSGAWPIATKNTMENKPQQLLLAATGPLSRTLSSDSDATDQRSSPISYVESDVSDPGNSLVPIPKSPPAGELTSWRCQQCLKTFTQRIALQLHVCPCQPSSPYQCGQCNLTFSDSSQLRAHVTSHSSEKPFKCGFCSRAFVGATTLNNHIKCHMGHKPFGCEKCGKTFSQPGLLERHVRSPRECKGTVSPTLVVA